MAIIVEDGTFVVNANSYVAVVYVDTFCSDLGLVTWAAATNADKESAILRAMAYIEGRNFKGVKADYDLNILKWPREGVEDEDGYAVEDDDIPENLKRASARASYEEIIESGVLQKNLTRGDFTTNETVGPISMSYEQGKSATVFRAIDAYLKGLVETPGILYRT